MSRELWIRAGCVGHGVMISAASGPVAVAYGPRQNPQSDDNVRLIVAAPALANALQDLLAELVQDPKVRARFSASMRLAQDALDAAGKAVPI